MAKHFQSRATVITWDLPGHGRSAGANDLDELSIAGCADDIRRVMDAAGVETATLIGFSLGCQIMFEAWRHISDRIDGFVPILGTYGRPFDNLLHPRVGPHLHRLFSVFGPPLAPAILAGTYAGLRTPMAHFLTQSFGFIRRDLGRDVMRPFYEHFALIEPRTWVALGLAAQEHTARDLLPTIDVPTLIVGGGRDALTPVHVSHEMHETIPPADLLMLPEATHAGLFEYPEKITEAVDHFLQSHGLVVPVSSSARAS